MIEERLHRDREEKNRLIRDVEKWLEDLDDVEGVAGRL